jgi:DNA methylase
MDRRRLGKGEQVKPFTNNPRTLSKSQAKRLKETMQEFGDLSGIVHDLETDEIIGGNQRSNVAALMQTEPVITERFEPPLADGTTLLGYFEFQGRRFTYRGVKGWDAEKRLRANLVANAGGGAWDTDLLSGIDTSVLTTAGFDTEMLLNTRGFASALDAMLKAEKPQSDAEPEIDRAAELLEKWQVKSGDMFAVGNHRLICGDCTDVAVVGRVMGGERAGACVTDSPYGINREGIENDDPEGLRALFDGCLAVMPIENGVIINFQSPRLFPVWLDAVRAAGHSVKRALWMYDENDQTKPWHYWLMCSQIAIISTLGKPEWLETKAHHDTYVIGLSREWRAGGSGNEFEHASVKPVGVVQDILSHIGGDVYDPFVGSGTTLVACENLSRRCRAIEISPAYVAVDLERMSTAFPDLEIRKVE